MHFLFDVFPVTVAWFVVIVNESAATDDRCYRSNQTWQEFEISAQQYQRGDNGNSVRSPVHGAINKMLFRTKARVLTAIEVIHEIEDFRSKLTRVDG